MKRIFLIMIAFGVCFFEIPVDAYEKSLKNVKVVIDAGHGGFDNGAIEYGYYEDNINLEIAMKMKDELEKSGAKVYLTRDGDYDMTKRNHHYSKQDDMYLRVKKIDSYKCDYLLSIHQNASGNRSAWGSQVFYYYRSKQGKALAFDIDQSLKQLTNSRKPISGCGFRVLRATKTLGVLIECGFLSNPEEEKNLQENTYQNKLAWGIYNGIMDYFL